jgi:hypothetical protein
MTIRHAVWRLGTAPEPLSVAVLPSEKFLEDQIVAAPLLLSDEWMLIGRQESIAYGGKVDLLAIAPDGAIILIELKRDRTPREVVAQALDYATWVQGLDAVDIRSIYGRFAPGASLESDFTARFGAALDEEALKATHQIVVVSAVLDDSSARIVRYLSDRGISINVLSFHVFADAQGLLLSRAWLLDPITSPAAVVAGPKGASEPWNGEFYASFGHGRSRSWSEAVRYGFISGGGGTWYSKTLQLLRAGDRVWVRVPGEGYVGVGRAIGEAQRAAEFTVVTADGAQPALDVLTEGDYYRELRDDSEQCEYFVPMEWLDRVAVERAVQEVGFFGNQNTVCKPVTPKWRHTVDRLKQLLPGYDGSATTSVVSLRARSQPSTADSPADDRSAVRAPAEANAARAGVQVGGVSDDPLRLP